MRYVKCVVWDLDDTIWNGVLLEDSNVTLRPGVVDVIQRLDERGILHSIASKNEPEPALRKLQEFKLDRYFLYPQINWGSKSASLKTIAGRINIGLDSMALVDDQPFELEEVRFSFPDILCIGAADLEKIVSLPEMNPPFVTRDSLIRRQMYQEDMNRQKCEQEFAGPAEAFLATLDMELCINEATEEDLRRAEELTVRTHQLNTTGYTYSYEELNDFRRSDSHRLLIAGLSDRFGSYGKIGLVLLECGSTSWTIKLFLMSCRVMSRGVGAVMLNWLIELAGNRNVSLLAEFISNGRNRMMYITYKFAGFIERERRGELIMLESRARKAASRPDYMKLTARIRQGDSY